MDPYQQLNEMLIKFQKGDPDERGIILITIVDSNLQVFMDTTGPEAAKVMLQEALDSLDKNIN